MRSRSATDTLVLAGAADVGAGVISEVIEDVDAAQAASARLAANAATILYWIDGKTFIPLSRGKISIIAVRLQMYESDRRSGTTRKVSRSLLVGQ